jgi:hypothetical protein
MKAERSTSVVELVELGIGEAERLVKRHPLPWTVVRTRDSGALLVRVKDARGVVLVSAVGEGAALVVELGSLAVGGFFGQVNN